MKTEDIEKHLFITPEDSLTAEKSAHRSIEDDERRKYQEQKQKEREEWDNILASRDSEFIKWLF